MELVDIYNDRHEKLDYTKERKSLENGENRLSCFIWVINDRDEILLQQRLASTKKMPNMWGTTAGGAQVGDSSLSGAIRELKEELGIIANKEEMIFIGSYKRINDFVEVWLYKKNINVADLILEPAEVQDARWFSIDDFEKMIADGRGINSGYDIFKMYYQNFYDRHYEIIDGKPVAVKYKQEFI
ncbi:MAG: NUDIX domain-containing protein [Bacilli bacterium]